MLKTETMGGKIKPAGYPTAYTDEQKVELYKCTRDPLYFITNYCWIVSTEGRMIFDLYEYQRRLIKHYVNYNKTITLLSRQAGKCSFSTTSLYIDGRTTSIWKLIDKSWKTHIVRNLEKLLIALARYAKNA